MEYLFTHTCKTSNSTVPPEKRIEGLGRAAEGEIGCYCITVQDFKLVMYLKQF